MSRKQFMQELERKLPQPVYLLTASDGFLLYDILGEIRAAFSDDGPFAVEVFDLASSDDCPPLAEVIDIMRTLAFFGARKTVILRSLQKLPKKEAGKLEEYCMNPSPDTALVMLHEGAAVKALEPRALKAVKSIPLSISERDIPLWVQERARAKGVTFTKDALEMLISSVGTDLGLLHAELDKLALAGVSGTVDTDTVRAVIYAGAEYGTFDLIHALEAGNVRQAFKRFESVRRSADPQMVLGALNWHYARRGGRPGLAVMSLLHEADIALKSSHQCVLERLIYNLCRR
ncbi:MAG TPA: DNA polymerase III subunit delta [Dissulfurispiraceae bacterium]|nr:DNA polymerase III subunit delta [Dissulfurispiraceae bacterium]